MRSIFKQLVLVSVFLVGCSLDSDVNPNAGVGTPEQNFLDQVAGVKTTLAKAKAIRPFAEKLITKAKTNDLHHKRQIMAKIYDKSIVFKLFEDIAPRFANRNGGYLCIVKLGQRQTDGTEMAIIDFVDGE